MPQAGQVGAAAGEGMQRERSSVATYSFGSAVVDLGSAVADVQHLDS